MAFICLAEVTTTTFNEILTAFEAISGFWLAEGQHSVGSKRGLLVLGTLGLDEVDLGKTGSGAEGDALEARGGDLVAVGLKVEKQRARRRGGQLEEVLRLEAATVAVGYRRRPLLDKANITLMLSSLSPDNVVAAANREAVPHGAVPLPAACDAQVLALQE